MTALRFRLNGRQVETTALAPTTTLLQYVRSVGQCGTKEGCAEGDCGACTVVVVEPDAEGGPRARAVNSCLLFLPMVQGKDVYTVEGLSQCGKPHPTQEAMVEALGSQCGYCTPGIVMSLVEACHRPDLDAEWKIEDQLCGNLCRCTGYRPIREAARKLSGTTPADDIAQSLAASRPGTTSAAMALDYQAKDHRYQCPPDFEALWDAMDSAPEARFVVGGTDLALLVTKRFESLPELISLEAIPELRRLEPGPDLWTIGASVTLSDLEAAAEDGFPSIARMLRFFAARQIKNRATVGGNLCNASPIGDMAPILMALGATCVLRSRTGERRVPLSDFFLAYRKTDRRPDEILAAAEVPVPPEGARVGAYKVSKRRELDISAVCAGTYVELDPTGHVSAIRLAYGGMAATTKRATATEQALMGRPWSEASIEAALPALDQDFQAIDDHRGSSWYRSTVAKNLLRGFFLETQQSAVDPRLPERPTGTVVLAAGDGA